MTPDGLPAFVGIGALKAGTTYLDGLLRDHPQLSLPRHLKEVEFFTRHHARGLGWYADQFDPPDGRLRGEISPQYMSDPACPQRVADANPAAKIVASLRDPVARTVSQYRHWVQETGYRGGFDTFLREHPNAVERSQYRTMLAPWLDRFGRDAVHIVVFDDLVGGPVATVRTLLRFLGVSDDYTPADADRASNVSMAPRFPRAYAAAKRLSRRLYRGDQAELVAALKRSKLVGLLKTGSVEQVRPVPDATRAELAERFRPDVEWLSALLERDLAARWLRRPIGLGDGEHRAE